MKKGRTKKVKQVKKDRVEVFSFGDPEPVLDGLMGESLGSALVDNGQWYLPPVSWQGLARLLRSNPFHGSILEFKINVVMRGFMDSNVLPRRAMHKAASDYIVFSNCYFQRIREYSGQTTYVRHLPAINMRRLRERGQYGFLTDAGSIVPFRLGEVVHIKNYDVTQGIYGMPWYLGAIQSMLLNEDATLFRRRYYRNGAHMGFILYSSSAGLSHDDQESIKKAVQQSKGIGNFRNVFLHIPGGREKDIQILPVGDFSTRDDLSRIKNLSRDDMIAAHRMPPALSSVIPEGAANFGDITKVDAVYQKNEIEPIRDVLLGINEWIPPAAHVRFEQSTYGSADEGGSTLKTTTTG